MRVMVTGATGYIGGRLIPQLLEEGHQVRCFARSPHKASAREWGADVEVIGGDMLDADETARALAGMDAAYYLVHSMGGSKDFADADERAATIFRDAAATGGVGQIVYLGGLGHDDDDLSAHLKSRHHMGEVLAAGSVPATELRAAVIIGSGRASFEMLRSLVDVLPAMVTPRWVTRTHCQPIAIRDVLTYLIGVLANPGARGQVLEIGGPDVLTYREMMDIYADEAGLRRRIVIPVPVLTPRLSSHWINVVTPLPMPLVRPLVDSLTTDVIVRDRRIEGLVECDPLPLREAIRLALARVQGMTVPTRWSGAEMAAAPAEPYPFDPGLVRRHPAHRRAPGHAAGPERIMRIVTGIGGARGWLVGEWLWSIRGLMDKSVGGVGMRRGRRHPDNLAVGDELDFFRVERLVPGETLFCAPR